MSSDEVHMKLGLDKLTANKTQSHESLQITRICEFCKYMLDELWSEAEKVHDDSLGIEKKKNGLDPPRLC